MAKRFIDTDLFRKPFMRSLEAPYKALWIYLLCECDHAGIWVVELDVAQIRMGLKLDPEKVIEKMGGAVVSIDGGSKWYLPDFVKFQYGTLNPSNRVHQSALERLERHGIDPNDSSQNKGLISPLQGAKDKDRDKDTQEGKERATIVTTKLDYEGFRERCLKVHKEVKLLSDADAKAFFDYWTEGHPETKPRYATMDKFDIAKRMGTWKRNNFAAKPEVPTISPTAKPWMQ
jgi:hypothetical protein